MERLETYADYRYIFDLPSGDDTCEATGDSIWAWLEGFAKNSDERRKIFDKVYKVSALPPDDESPGGSAKQFRAEMYQKRAKIVHGRDGVRMTLGEFVQSCAFVAKSMEELAQQCREKLKVVV